MEKEVLSWIWYIGQRKGTSLQKNLKITKWVGHADLWSLKIKLRKNGSYNKWNKSLLTTQSFHNSMSKVVDAVYSLKSEAQYTIAW